MRLFALPALLTRCKSLSALLLLASLSVTASAAEEFLEPAKAFQVSAQASDGQTVTAHFTIAPGYYLYREKFKFTSEERTLKLQTPRYPPGQAKQDDNFGAVEVYHNAVDIPLPLGRKAGDGPRSVNLKVVYQGCAEAGLCYPPQTQLLRVDLPPAQAGQQPAAGNAPGIPAPGSQIAKDAAGPAATPAPPASGDNETSRIAATLKKAGFWTSLLFFFAAGLGLALTPCVFPMVPILSGIIVGSGGKRHVSRGRAFVLSLAYVLGMAITYALAGVAAGLSGTLLSNALQNAWVLGAFGLVFVALSFSMFGFYELQLPTFLQSKVSEEASHLHGGSLPAVAAMGALSALICGPCVAAPLAGALLYIGQTRDALLGGAALFSLALGMGAPLLLVGLSAGTLLPKTGPWMEGVKKSFGVLLLGVALWFVAPVLPPVLVMLGWAVLLIVPAIYLHALDPLPHPIKGWQRFWKGMGVVMLLWGAAILLGALAGNRDALKPLTGLGGGKAVAAEGLRFAPIRNVAELDARLRGGTPVMLDFYADWCVSCKEMERETFVDPAVIARLRGWTLLRTDVTANSGDDQALLQRFGLYGPPGIIVFDARGKEVAAARVVGFQDGPTFLRSLAVANF